MAVSPTPTDTDFDESVKSVPSIAGELIPEVETSRVTSVLAAPAFAPR